MYLSVRVCSSQCEGASIISSYDRGRVRGGRVRGCEKGKEAMIVVITTFKWCACAVGEASAARGVGFGAC